MALPPYGGYNPSTNTTTSYGISSPGAYSSYPGSALPPPPPTNMPYYNIGSNNSGGMFNPRKLTKAEINLINQQAGIANTMNKTMKSQLAQAKFYNNYIRSVTPTSDGDRQKMLALNKNMIALQGQQVKLRSDLINAAYKDAPKYRAMEQQKLKVYENNLTLINLQNQTALETEPERLNLLFKQIEGQIKAVGASINSIDLQDAVTAHNMQDVLQFAKQNLTYQKTIDQRQFGNIMTSQDIEARQLDIFDRMLPKVEAFQDEQFRVVSKQQGLSDQQIDLKMQELGLKQTQLGIEETQALESAGVFGQQAGVLSSELAAGKSDIEEGIKKTGLTFLSELDSTLAGGSNLPGRLISDEKNIIRKFVEEQNRKGLNVTGTTLEDLTAGEDSASIASVNKLRETLLNRRDDFQIKERDALVSGFGSLQNNLASERGARRSLISAGVGTGREKASLENPNLVSLKSATPDLSAVQPNIAGLSNVSLMSGVNTAVNAPTFTSNKVTAPIMNTPQSYALKKGLAQV